jgi:hypothetical protein
VRSVGVVARPEPNLNTSRRALNGIPSTTVVVELRAIAQVRVEPHRATDVVVDVGITVLLNLLPKHATTGTGHRAARAGVESGGVGSIVVRTFEDVEFTSVRPVGGVDFPDSGPGSAALGHVSDIEHGDVVAVVLLGYEANRITSRSVGFEDVNGVGAEDEGLPSAEGVVIAERGLAVDVVPKVQSAHEASELC